MFGTDCKGRFYFYLRIYICTTICFIIGGTRLNVPKVLLPYYGDAKSNFTLEATDGCYTWTSQRHDVVEVNMINEKNGCSKSALLTVSSRSPTRVTSVITAAERTTNQILRCDVIVDKIHEIQARTTTRELFLADSPEQFRIFALDIEGNTFSSLEGIAFEWLVQTDTGAKHGLDGKQVIKLIPFENAEYDPPADIVELERRGKQGSMILLEGLQTGTAYVNVQLRDSVYKHLPSHRVRLIVVANVIILPSEAYILKGVEVAFQVLLIKHGHAEDVKMPSKHYHFEVSDKEKCGLNTDKSSVAGQQIGSCNLVLYDNLEYTPVNHTRQFPTSVVHVVVPHYIKIVVRDSRLVGPNQAWLLITDRKYIVEFFLYDGANNKINFGLDNIQFAGTFLPDAHQIHYQTTNGSYYIISALRVGLADIEAKLTFEGSSLAESTMSHGVDPLLVIPQLVLFPYAAAALTHSFSKEIEIRGGSGKFGWVVNDSSICTVVTSSFVVKSGSKFGRTNIVINDLIYPSLTGGLQVGILPIKRIEFVPSQIEAVYGSYLMLKIAIFVEEGKKLVPVTNCLNFKFDSVEVDNTLFEVVENIKEETFKGLDDKDKALDNIGAELQESRSRACTTLVLRAKYVTGFTKVIISHFNTSDTLTAVRNVAVYPDVRLNHPVLPRGGAAQSLILLPFSEATLDYFGGPNPWILDPVHHYYNLTAVNDVKFSPPVRNKFEKSNLIRTQLTCSFLGSYTIEVAVGNNPTVSNPLPAVSMTTTNVNCEEPKVMRLFPDVKSKAGLPPCPVTTVDKVPALKGSTMPIIVRLFAKDNQQFYNISTLAIVWTFNDTVESVKSASKNGGKTSQPNLKFGKVRDVEEFYRDLTFPKVEGSYIVKAEAVGFFNPSKSSEVIYFKQKLSQIITFHLVGPPKLNSSSVNLFNAVRNFKNVKVNHGSRYFYVSSLNPDNMTSVKVINKVNSRLIRFEPVEAGFNDFVVDDLCLDAAASLKLAIHVLDVYSIHIQSLSKVEVKNQLEVDVILYDKSGLKLTEIMLKYVSLTANYDESIISLTYERSTVDAVHVYRLYAKHVGTTDISFKSSHRLPHVASNTQSVQVYEPLTVQPHYLTLMIGSYFQLITRGGPQDSSATINYECRGNCSIGEIAQTGIFSALEVGLTEIIVSSVATEYGDTVIYGEDRSIIRVIQLDGVKIWMPIKWISVGNVMPLIATGRMDDVNPFSFGMSDPSLTFDWSIYGDSGLIASVYDKIGIRNLNSFAVRFRAVQPGQTTVRLKLTQSSSGLQMRAPVVKDECIITVVEPLELITPSICTSSLLIAHNSNTQFSLSPAADASGRIRHRFSTFDMTSSGSGQLVPTVASPAQNSKLVTINQDGRLKSSTLSGDVLVWIESVDDRGINTTKFVHVKVAPVAYIMLSVNSKVFVRNEFESRVKGIPSTSTLSFVLSYHDILGTKFHAISPSISYRLNRYDRADFRMKTMSERITLKSHLSMEGSFILKVIDISGLGSSNDEPGYLSGPPMEDEVSTSVTNGVSSPPLADYVPVTIVSSAIELCPLLSGGGGATATSTDDLLQPMEIIVSDPLYLSTQFETTDAEWECQDPSVMAIFQSKYTVDTPLESAQFIALALASGRTSIQFTSSDLINSFKRIEVKPIESISLEDDSKSNILSNSEALFTNLSRYLLRIVLNNRRIETSWASSNRRLKFQIPGFVWFDF